MIAYKVVSKDAIKALIEDNLIKCKEKANFENLGKLAKTNYNEYMKRFKLSYKHVVVK